MSDELSGKEISGKAMILSVLGVFTVLVIVSMVLMYVLPKYNVWSQEMSGRAAFAKAEQDRKILVEEAKSRLESEKLNAQSEIERAKGMSEAMRIENGQLTSEYNQYLFIRTLEKLADKGDLPQIIYIPTKGLLPVMDIKETKQGE